MNTIKKNIKKFLRKNISQKKRVYFNFIKQLIKILVANSHYLRTSRELDVSEQFNNYYFKLDSDKKAEKITNLKMDLDKKDIDEIENILSRQDYILKHNLLEKKIIFSAEDLLDQKKWERDYENIQKRIKGATIKDFRPESFYGISGLRWASQKTKDSLKKGVFVDIGACDGDSSFAFCFNFNPEKIYSFEPEKNNYARLKDNIKILNMHSIEPIKLGVSDSSGKSYISKEDGRSKVLNGGGGEEIEIISLDKFVESNKIKMINLIKIDIEGMEMSALKGAECVIKKFTPVIAVSIYHKPEDFFEIKPYLKKICPNYKFFIKKANPETSFDETMLIAYINKDY